MFVNFWTTIYILFEREEDVTRTMYTAAYNRLQLMEESEGSCKVDTVCDVLRTALIEEDENKWETPKKAIERNSHIGVLEENMWC